MRQGWRERDQGLQVEGDPSLEKVLEEDWRYWILAQRSFYTATVFIRVPAIDRAPTRRSRTSSLEWATKNCENSRWMSKSYSTPDTIVPFPGR